MTLPWRMWIHDMVGRTLHCKDSDNNCNVLGDYTDEHLAYMADNVCYLGLACEAGPWFHQWRGVMRCDAADHVLEDGMDEICDYGFLATLYPDYNNVSTQCTVFSSMLDDPNVWTSGGVTGQHYDGVHQWGSYPPTHHNKFDNTTFTFASLPISRWCWGEAYDTGHRCNQYQDELFGQGVYTYVANCDGCLPCDPGEQVTFYLALHAVKVNYLNPVVNSLNRMHMPAVGGVRLVLHGLGFDQDDCELADNTRYSQNNCGFAWNSIVDYIYFEGLQGQGTTELSRVAGDFTIVSDSRIVIQNMPALTAGTYNIRLKKTGVGVGAAIGDVEAYAGDWQAGDDGQVSRGVRFSFFVGEYVDPPRPPILTFNWKWIIGGLEVDAYYAPIDTRAPGTFWDGRVLSVSSLKRSIDDMSGLFNVSDVTVTLASQDKEFQKLLAQGYCKNQIVEIAHGWATEPVGWRHHVFHGIVDDNDLPGAAYNAVIKDISRKHFRKKMPRYMITEDEWPDAHENALGMGYPELIGLHNHATGAQPGAIEAHCVDTVNFKYAAGGGPVNITQVWSAAAPQTEGAGNDYTISFDALGRTYIDFNADQGDNKITFNCEGYSFALWDSANGYVQNPAYVLLFYIVFVCQVPLAFIDLNSFDTMAAQFVSYGFDDIGRLACAEIKDADAYLQELLFSFGAKLWPDRFGRFKVGRKDLSNYDTDLTFWAQIDLMDAPHREYHLPEAINFAKARWDYQPAPSLWLGATAKEREDVVEDYGERNEDTWDYPWISSAEFATQRIAEDFRRLAYGHRTVTFALPMEYVATIDIFDNFKLQDPYDIHPTGEGSAGRYYYITGLDYQWMEQKIGVEAEDLSWLVSQCFIVGRCSEIANSWENATEWMRFFGYVGSCATNKLPGGSPLKIICPCD